MWINTTTLGEFVLHSDIRYELWKENQEAPAVLTDEYLASVGYAVLTPVYPTFDPITQRLAPRTGALENGVWVKHFDVIPLGPEQVDINQQIEAERVAQIIPNKIQALWQAADTYERNYISGVAIGLLTMGVMQAAPKATAVAAWSAALWTEYYTRKAGITESSSLNLDFSSFGPIPFSVPELRTELGM